MRDAKQIAASLSSSEKLGIRAVAVEGPKPPFPATHTAMRLVERGLIWPASPGEYRLTDAGRAVLPHCSLKAADEKDSAQ